MPVARTVTDLRQPRLNGNGLFARARRGCSAQQLAHPGIGACSDIKTPQCAIKVAAVDVLRDVVDRTVIYIVVDSSDATALLVVDGTVRDDFTELGACECIEHENAALAVAG